MATIAPVKVPIEAVDRLTRPVRSIMSNLSGLRSRLSSVLSVAGKLGAALAGVGVAAVAAATKLFTSFVSRAGEVSDAAKRIGITAEQLQELRFVAEQAGVSSDVLGTSLTKFLTLPGAKIENLGLIADRIAAITDAGEKVRVMRALFGRGGPALIPLFDQGSAGINAQIAEGRKLGIFFSNAAAAAGDELGDRFALLKRTASGIADEVSGAFAPRVTQAINDLLVFLAANRATVTRDLTKFSSDLLEGARELVKAVPDLKAIASDLAMFAREVGPVLRTGNQFADFLNRTAGSQAGPPTIDLPGLLRRGAEGVQRGADSVQRFIFEPAPGLNIRPAPGQRAPGVTIKAHMGPMGVGFGAP